MKNYTIYLLSAILIFTACNKSQKLLTAGQYDQAIDKSIQKIRKKRKLEKNISVLETAYKKANQRDREKIQFLKTDGSPDNWDNIFELYSTLKYRQEKIKPLLPLEFPSTNRRAVFEMVNYDQEIISAKQKSAEYFYVHALSLLEKGDQYNARKAYEEFSRVRLYYPNYKNVNDLIIKSRAAGTSYVLFKMQNKTGVPLPPNFEEELTKISLSELNRDWLVYETREMKDRKYNYTILVNMKQIDVSPESVKENNYTESKQIPDGYEYTLDAKGNVKKDSLGNDIKKQKFKTITCTVTETYQNKKAIIAGTLDYIDNYTGQLVKTDPIASENFFEYSSGSAIGDLNALKAETKNKIGRKPVPFPSNFDMIFAAGQKLKIMVKDIIWANKGVLN